MKCNRISLTLAVLGILFFLSARAKCYDLANLFDCVEEENYNTCQFGGIDTFVIESLYSKFCLSKGSISIIELNKDDQVALFYTGKGKFSWILQQNDDPKEYSSAIEFDTLVIFGGVGEWGSMEGLKLKQREIDNKTRQAINKGMKWPYEYIDLDTRNMIIENLMSNSEQIILAAFSNKQLGNFAYINDHRKSYPPKLFRFYDIDNRHFAKKLKGPALRLTEPLFTSTNITDYGVNIKIADNGRVEATTLIGLKFDKAGTPYVNFEFGNDYNILSTFAGNADSLILYKFKNSGNLGISIMGFRQDINSTHISIAYQPDNSIQFDSAFHLQIPYLDNSIIPRRKEIDCIITLDLPEYYNAILCGRKISERILDSRRISTWKVNSLLKCITFIPFKINNKDLGVELASCLNSTFSGEQEITLFSLKGNGGIYGNQNTWDYDGGNTVVNALKFFVDIWGDRQIDTLSSLLIPPAYLLPDTTVRAGVRENIIVNEIPEQQKGYPYAQGTKDEHYVRFALDAGKISGNLGGAPFFKFTGNPDKSRCILNATLESLNAPGLMVFSYIDDSTKTGINYDSYIGSHAAHQWLTDLHASKENQWIIAGLEKYCGLWFIDSTFDQDYSSKSIIDSWRNSAFSIEGQDALDLSVSMSDYSDEELEARAARGAYLFHSIRCQLYDYKTGSDSLFKSFINELLTAFSIGEVTEEGLNVILSSYTGINMIKYLNQWVHTLSIPEFVFSFRIQQDSGQYQIIGNVEATGVINDFNAIIPVSVELGGGRYIPLKIAVTGKSSEVKLPWLPYKPVNIIVNHHQAVLCHINVIKID